MHRPSVRLLIPLGAALLCAATVVVWLRTVTAPAVDLRLPGPDDQVGGSSVTSAKQVNTGTLVAGAGTPSEDPGQWPQFRGADRSNIVREAGSLSRVWPTAGLEVLWKLEVGEGHAGPAIRDGRLYLVDYDQQKEEDAIRCLSLKDGSELWRYTYSVRVKRNHGMSRTVPAVTGNYLVALGPKCHVHCLDSLSGELVWKMDLVADHGTEEPPWYAGQCPLIDGDRVILAPGGSPLMMAVELNTGRVLWETPNPGKWGMTHSSIVPMDLADGRQYVYCSTQGVVGISARDGKLLWKFTDWRIALATIPSPVVVGGGSIFLSGGYNSGCMMVRVVAEGGLYRVEPLWRLPHTVFGSDQQTPILFENHLYGVIPGGELACLDLEGKLAWTSGSANRFGLGPFLLADRSLLVLNDQKGTLHLVDASPAGYNELTRAKVLSGHDAWGPMALVNGKLFVRDLTTLECLRMP